MRKSIIKQVEAEYQQPFLDVVLGFAADGESMTATAAMLGYSGTHRFIEWVDRHGLRDKFVVGSQSVGAMESRKAAGCTLGRLWALRAASAANPTYVRVELDGILDTLAGHARRKGLSASTVYKRHSRGLPMDQVLYAGSFVRVPDNSGHWWRQ